MNTRYWADRFAYFLASQEWRGFFFFLMIDTTFSFIMISEKRKFYDAEIYKNEVY